MVIVNSNKTSFFFQIISVISISFVVVSTIGMTLNTMPSIRVQHEGMDESIDNPKLALIEAVCISWFTIEYLLRLAGKERGYYVLSTHILVSIENQKNDLSRKSKQ